MTFYEFLLNLFRNFKFINFIIIIYIIIYIIFFNIHLYKQNKTYLLFVS